MAADPLAIELRMPNEVFNQGKLEVVDEIMSPDMIEHMPVPPEMAGIEGFKSFVRGFRAAFPDLHYDVQVNLSDRDLVTTVAKASATMKGEFRGMPASGKRAEWTEIHVARVRDGKIVEHWGVIDEASMMRQLGFAPDPAGSPAG